MIYVFGHISPNYGPIFKIKNLAYSGGRGPSGWIQYGGARDDAREIASRARDVIYRDCERDVKLLKPNLWRQQPDPVCVPLRDVIKVTVSNELINQCHAN